MNYWLVKSEPSVYSWQQLLLDKESGWEGVRNYAARNNLRAMKKGDEVFFYHSNEGLEIVGIAKVSKEAFQDPTTEEPAWLSVKIKPFKTLKKAVPLSVMKLDPRLKEFPLIRIGRLSVMPVSKEEYAIIMALAS